jgi:2-iminobutanoate/2-iminopropanoate deaminase
MERKVIVSSEVPGAIGPYSLGIQAGDLIFVSGTIGVDPSTGEFAPGGVAAQTRQVLTNMSKVLAAAGSSMESVLKTTVFLTDLGEFSSMNEVYADFFQTDPPARSTIEVSALPGGAVVEIEAIAYRS